MIDLINESTYLEIVSNHGIMELILPGRGLQGEPGPPGGNFSYEQPSASLTWTIVHNLGFRPAGIYVEDSAGTTQSPSVVHLDVNTVVLEFLGATDGFAILS